MPLNKLKLGIIGQSEGNGHPYSWSAIFNGYNPEFMKDCPFTAIPGYLSKQKFPEDSLGHLGRVTNIWTQNKELSNHIAASSNIDHVEENMEDMIGKVDAVLLARDDAENHYEMSYPFLKAGLPVFIDKPLALSVDQTNKILAAQKYPNQVFSCSSLRYCKELLLTDLDKRRIGEIKFVEASVMSKWETYGIHILEPIISQLPDRGKLIEVKSISNDSIKQVLVKWDNVSAYFKVTGNIFCPLEYKFFGEKDFVNKELSDTFNAFKGSLQQFINVINFPDKNIDNSETLEMIRILESAIS